MRAPAVLESIALLSRRGVEVWVTGGWGVDALVGRQTRDHADLDVSIPSGDRVVGLKALDDRGFSVVTDWLPTRIALAHPELGEIDVHPITFEDDGSAWLPGIDGERFVYPSESLTTGTIQGSTVACIDAALQLTFHLGYEPSATDRADMHLLANAGLITLPEGYR